MGRDGNSIASSGHQSCSCAQLVQKSSAHPDPREALTSQQKSIKVTNSKSIISVLTFNSNSKGKAMPEEVKVILELSDDVQTLLEEQGIDLYQELQQELPSIHLQKQSDPEAPSGSRDLATVILATASLVTALTPVIIRILNQITPAHRAQTWIVEEIETRHPDGTTTIQRKRVLSSNESRSIEQPADQQTPTKPAISEATKETKEP
jgi:hypothetical protein